MATQYEVTCQLFYIIKQYFIAQYSSYDFLFLVCVCVYNVLDDDDYYIK